MNPDVIGWASTAILVLTIGRQVFTQWRERTTAGVSRWLFVGQLAASTGFAIYSAMLGNIVFVVSNVFLLMIAVVGQVLYLRNRKREERTGTGARPGGDASAAMK